MTPALCARHTITASANGDLRCPKWRLTLPPLLSDLYSLSDSEPELELDESESEEASLGAKPSWSFVACLAGAPVSRPLDFLVSICLMDAGTLRRDKSAPAAPVLTPPVDAAAAAAAVAAWAAAWALEAAATAL